MPRLCDKENIYGKDIYVVNSHHFILQPWAEIRRQISKAPTLITLDHHTDTHEAFQSYRCVKSNYDSDLANSLLPKLISNVDYGDEDSLLRAISKLRYDEHIHTAFLLNIISCAFSINLSDQEPSIEEKAFRDAIQDRFALLMQGHVPGPMPSQPIPPYTYAKRDDGMYTISAKCAIRCNKSPHDDECIRIRADQVLESFYLDHELETANRMANAVGLSTVDEQPYILDIDLDYFHSEKAITPDDPTTFYHLVRNAIAVTVALEPECVKELRCEGSSISAQSLLEKLKEHVATAMK